MPLRRPDAGRESRYTRRCDLPVGQSYERIALPPSPASVAGAAISMETLPHVTFLAAVEKNKLAPEDYKLDWSKYRLNFNIQGKDKTKVMALRQALHTIVDGLVLN